MDYPKPPYLPAGRTLNYVALGYSDCCEIAGRIAHRSQCSKKKTGAVLVKDGVIIGRGNNAPQTYPGYCPRERSRTGENYAACWEVCHQPAHAEVAAIENALGRHAAEDLEGAELYLFGHWWVCRDCWELILRHKLGEVFIVVGS